MIPDRYPFNWLRMVFRDPDSFNWLRMVFRDPDFQLAQDGLQGSNWLRMVFRDPDFQFLFGVKNL